MKIFFGCISNDEKIMRRILLASDLEGATLWQAPDPESAAKGLNGLLDMTDGYDIAVLVHHDIYLPPGWVSTLRYRLNELPDSWVVAGVYGIGAKGEHCGKVLDRRTPKPLFTAHTFPQPALSLDACCLIVNLSKGFRFDEGITGFDLYDVYAAMRANELGTAWIIDCPPEHYATRPVEWQPDETFVQNWRWLKERFPGKRIYHTCCTEAVPLTMEGLTNKYEGQTAWIVGLGPSLEHLKVGDLGPGPKIPIGSAVHSIETLGFTDHVYSMQKGGGKNKEKPNSLTPDCRSRECDKCPGMARPEKATLLVHDLESLYCFEDYSPRVVYTLADIGLQQNVFSLVAAVMVAKLMGCTKINLVSCDFHVSGDIGRAYADGRTMTDEFYKASYGEQKRILPEYLKDIEHSWITPSDSTLAADTATSPAT
jgi:hypothetical protein